MAFYDNVFCSDFIIENLQQAGGSKLEGLISSLNVLQFGVGPGVIALHYV